MLVPTLDTDQDGAAQLEDEVSDVGLLLVGPQQGQEVVEAKQGDDHSQGLQHQHQSD